MTKGKKSKLHDLVRQLWKKAQELIFFYSLITKNNTKNTTKNTTFVRFTIVKEEYRVGQRKGIGKYWEFLS